MEKAQNRPSKEPNQIRSVKPKRKKRKSKLTKSFKIHEYGENPKRYLIGIIYALLSVMMGMSSNPLTPIAVTIARAYDLEIELVNLTSAAYFFTTSIVTFPSIFLIRKLGVPSSIKLAAFLTTLGFICRTMIRVNIFIVIGGQVLAGIAGPFLFTTQTRVISQWFNEKDRGLWLTICSLSAPFGILLGNFLLIFLIDTSGKSSKETNKTQIYNCLLGEAAASCFICLMAMIFWKRGATRQSILVMKKKKALKKQNGGVSLILNDKEGEGQKASTSIWEQLKHIFNRNYLILVSINYILCYGVITASGALLTEIIHAFEYEEKYGAMCNIAAIFSGAAFSLIFSCFFMKKKNQFKGMIYFTFFLALIQGLCIYVYVKELEAIYVVVLNGLVGCVVFPIIPMTFEEMMSRLDPSHLITITSFLQTGNQIVAVAIISFGGQLFNKPTKKKATYFAAATGIVYIVAFLLNFFIRFAGKSDAERPSVKRRIKTKEDLVNGPSKDSKEDEEVNEGSKVSLEEMNKIDKKVKNSSNATLPTSENLDENKQEISKITATNSDGYQSLPTLSQESSMNRMQENEQYEEKTIEKITEEFIAEMESDQKRKEFGEIYDPLLEYEE